MNRLQPGVMVSGSYGDLIDIQVNNQVTDDANKKKTRKRKILHGVIQEAVGERKWRVVFENGSVRECPSNRLRFECGRPPLNHQSTSSTMDGEVVDATIVDTTMNQITTSTTTASLLDNTITNETATSIRPDFRENRNEVAMMAEVEVVTIQESAATSTLGANIDDVFNSVDAETTETTDFLTNVVDDFSEYFGDGTSIEVEDIALDQEQEEDIIESEDNIQAEEDIEVNDEKHKIKWQKYIEEKEKLIEENFTVKKGRVTWRVCRDSVPDASILEFKTLGIREVIWSKFQYLSEKLKKKSSTRGQNLFSTPTKSNTTKLPTPFLDLFLALWPGDWQQQLHQMNDLIKKEQEKSRKNQSNKNSRKVREVTPNEFFVFIGIIVVAAAAQTGGKNLYQSAESYYKQGYQKVLPPINMSKYMTKTRFNEIRSKFDYAFEDRTKSDRTMPDFDPWYKVSKFVEEFNSNRTRMIAASIKKVLDESMAAWRPRKTRPVVYRIYHIFFESQRILALNSKSLVALLQ